MRKLDHQFSISFVIAAAAFVSALGTEQLFAQKGGIANSLRKSSPLNAQLQGNVPPTSPLLGDQFQERLDKAIEITSKRYMTANAHSPWQIFHGILALRKDCQLRLGNEKVNAIEWMSTAEPQFNKQPWMFLTPHGAKFHPYNNVKYHFEGHPGQFLALLSESDLPLEHQIKVEGKVVTLNDVVNNTMKEVNSREEVTWVLWALQHYLKPDAVWVNQAKETWSIEKLVQIETAQPVIGAPCGGNHRLFALTRARDKYLQSGGKLRGVWLEADQKINKHIEIARSLQNRDGSFSSDSYKGPNHTTDINNRFNTTGHTMEFLAISLPKERLNEPWVKNAVWTLCNELIYYQQNEIDAGPLFHTLDALILYRDRIRPMSPAKVPDPSSPEPQVASLPLSGSAGTGLTSAPDKAKQIPDDQRSAKPGEVASSDPIPFPSKEGVVVPNAKTAESSSESLKLVMPRVPNPQPDAMARRGTAQKMVPKLDPSQLNDVGEPAPGTRAAQDKQRLPRAAAPNLLPETFARPLLISENPAIDSKPSADGVGERQPTTPGWRPTPSERLGKPSPSEKAIVKESPPNVEERQTASALEPSNL